LTVPFSLGPGALRALVVLALIELASFALLRPFLSEPDRRAVLALTGVAGGAALLVLLLADSLDVSARGAVLLLAVVAVPVAVALRGSPSSGRVDALLRSAAPGVLLVAAAGVGVELVRAWLLVPGPEAEKALHTALIVGIVGLSWLTLCRPRAARLRAGVHAVSALLGTGIAGGAALLAVSGAG
jgi:hypothetical protein